jgi:tight adherence protein C
MTLQEMLPFGMSLEDAIVILVGLTVLGLGAGLTSGVFANDRLTARIRMVSRTGVTQPREAKADRARPKQSALDMMRRVVEISRLLRGRQTDKYAAQLGKAGYRNKDALVAYLFAKLVTPFAFGGAAIVAFYVLPMFELPDIARLCVVLFTVLIGSYLPDLYVRRAVNKRKAKIRKALPDALDLIVICVEAGLSLDAALQRVAQEARPMAPELADELDFTTFELGILPDRKMALENLGQRVDINAVQSLASTLEQSERFGTPLAQALRVVASELRNDRLMRAEEKAARLPATMTVPLIMFILPALLIVVLGPAMLDVLDALQKM